MRVVQILYCVGARTALVASLSLSPTLSLLSSYLSRCSTSASSAGSLLPPDPGTSSRIFPFPLPFPIPDASTKSQSLALPTTGL